MTCFLSIDVGTSAVKAGVIDDAGTLLGVGTAEYALDIPRSDWVECDVDVYWASIKRATGIALREARSGRGPDVAPAALCIVSQGETLLCLDEELEPLRPAIVWLDNRAQEEARRISEHFGDETIYLRTGQTDALATWPACKLSWLKRNEPRTFADARWFTLIEDWVIARLTGRVVGETSLWSSSLMLDIVSGRWWEDMLEHIGVDPQRLPSIVPPGELVGRLRPGIADELGLPNGLPVVAGGLDFVLATTGAGNLRPGVVTELTGSVLAINTCLDQPPTDRSSGLPIYRHVLPDTWCASPYSQTGGLALRWIRDNFYGPPGQRSCEVEFDDVVAEGATVAPGADGVLFLPHLAGAWYPEFDLTAKAAVVGLTLAHGRAHVVRAALESVAYMLKVHLDGLRAVGVEPERIISLGPSAQSLTWRAIKADVTHLPIDRIRCPEASLLGGAMLAAVGIDVFEDLSAAAEAMGETFDCVNPEPRNARVYDERFLEYRELYDLLKPTFHYSTHGGAHS
jgi:xylulokinase